MRWLTIGVGLAAVSAVVSGQDALPDWVMRLSRVKHHLRDNFVRIPNYVCKESVDRYQETRGREVAAGLRTSDYRRSCPLGSWERAHLRRSTFCVNQTMELIRIEVPM